MIDTDYTTVGPVAFSMVLIHLTFYWFTDLQTHQNIEDICLFEVNTKYISSRELKISEFSRVRSTSENFDVFNPRDEIYLVFTEKRQIFFLFYTIHGHFPIHKAGGEMRKPKIFENTNKLIPHRSLRSN